MPKNRAPITQVENSSHAVAASRASWIGEVQHQDFNVPVKAYSCIASPESHLHLIHAAGCGRRVTLSKVCPEHGILEASEIRKAFAYSSDLLVELSEDELAQLNPIDDKKIVIDRFVSPERLDLALLSGRTLFLVPASPAAHHSFHLFKEALEQKQIWALGRTVFSQKRQLVVIRSNDEKVFLHTLHDPALRRLPVPYRPCGDGPSRSEIQQLSRAMSDNGDPIPWTEYSDDYQEQLANLVATKVRANSDERSEKVEKAKTTKLKRRRRGEAVTKAA